MSDTLKCTVGALALLGTLTLANTQASAFSIAGIDSAYTITANMNGSFTFHNDGNNTFGSEDVLIYVVNNSGKTLNSIALSSKTDAFGFDGDGIDGAAGVSPALGNPDTTGYGGPLGFFTNIDPINNYYGTVNFAGGLANGANTYFSLENQLAAPGGGGLGTVPLPASAPMFGGALLALGLFGYRVKRRAGLSTQSA